MFFLAVFRMRSQGVCGFFIGSDRADKKNGHVEYTSPHGRLQRGFFPQNKGGIFHEGMV